jgi:hypothetical protein
MNTVFWLESLKVRDHSEDQAWEDNFKMDLREMGWKGVDWINLAQGRYLWQAVVNMVMILLVP